MLNLAMPELCYAGRYRSAEPACALHAHPAFELLAIRAGRCRVEIQGYEPFEAGVGDLFLIPPTCAHIHRNHGEVATSYLVFRLTPRLLPRRLRHFTIGDGDRLLDWLEQLVGLHRSLAGADAREAGGLLLAIISRIDQLDPPWRRSETSRPLPLALAERHLLANLAGPVGMAELARISGVGERHLRELFCSHHGCPPARWHRQRRLELAQRLLADEYLSIAQVAAACGWEDANLFGRTFRAHVGRTPGAWRSAVWKAQRTD